MGTVGGGGTLGWSLPQGDLEGSDQGGPETVFPGKPQ